MTVNWYIEHGFEMSSQMSQTVVDRAESQIVANYLLPIVEGSARWDADIYNEALGTLSFLLLCQQSVKLTRAGAKIKETAESDTAGRATIDGALVTTCASLLKRLWQSTGKDGMPLFTDICMIYFKSNFFYN